MYSEKYNEIKELLEAQVFHGRYGWYMGDIGWVRKPKALRRAEVD